MEVAPTLLINLADVTATGLLRPGSVAEYELLFAGNEAELDRFRPQLEARMTPEQELRDIRDGRPEVRSSLERAEQFLVHAEVLTKGDREHGEGARHRR